MADFSFKQSRKTPKGVKPCPIRRKNKAKQPLLFGPQRPGGEPRVEFGNWSPIPRCEARAERLATRQAAEKEAS